MTEYCYATTKLYLEQLQTRLDKDGIFPKFRIPNGLDVKEVGKFLYDVRTLRKPLTDILDEYPEIIELNKEIYDDCNRIAYIDFVQDYIDEYGNTPSMFIPSYMNAIEVGKWLSTVKIATDIMRYYPEIIELNAKKYRTL